MAVAEVVENKTLRVGTETLEELVGGFSRPDAADRIEALAHMDPGSLAVFVKGVEVKKVA